MLLYCICLYDSMFIFRKKHGSIKFFSKNEPVDKKSIELVTEPPAAYEYISLETDLTIKSNDDGGGSKVEKNEEEADIEHHYEDMSNKEKEEMEQHYENMTGSMRQDKSKEAEMGWMENKVEMKEEAIDIVTEPAAAYEYISIKTNLTIKSNDDGRDNGKETKLEENEKEEEEDMEHHYEVMIGSIQDKSKKGEMRGMEIKVEMRKNATENENPIEAVYANISKKKLV